VTTAFARLSRLSPAEIALLAEATLALALASFAVACLPFDLFARTARPSGPSSDENAARARARAVRWAVAASARRVPWRAKCLEQAFAAQWMLRRRSVPAVIHYGIRRADDSGLLAHAWVRAGAIDVIGCEGTEAFTEVARFPADREALF
jgi:hypothetical protein